MDDQVTPVSGSAAPGSASPGSGVPGSAAAGSADPALAGRDYGEVLWEPGPEAIDSARVTAYARWLADHRGLDLRDHEELWQWPAAAISA